MGWSPASLGCQDRPGNHWTSEARSGGQCRLEPGQSVDNSKVRKYGTGLGRDYTVFATVTGRVRFEHATRAKKRIRVEAEAETVAAG